MELTITVLPGPGEKAVAHIASSDLQVNLQVTADNITLTDSRPRKRRKKPKADESS